MNWIGQLSEGLQVLAGVVLALYALASTLSVLLGFAAAFYPPLLKWASWCSVVGLKLHNLGLKLGSGLPGAAKVGPMAILTIVGFLGSAAMVSGCNPATEQLTAVFAPIVENGLCKLASDQGTAEPGWEIYVCDVLDGSGKPTGATLMMKTRKGAPPVSAAKIAAR